LIGFNEVACIAPQKGCDSTWPRQEFPVHCPELNY
jgi:hypothetical protein